MALNIATYFRHALNIGIKETFVCLFYYYYYHYFVPACYCRIISPLITYKLKSYLHALCMAVLFLSPELLLKYSRQGFETCNTVKTCIKCVHKGHVILIQLSTAELYSLVRYTYFDHISMPYIQQCCNCL